MKTFARVLAASMAAMLSMPNAQAGILGFGTHNSPFVPGAIPTQIQLRDNGATTVAFRTARDNTLVVVTYNAECAATSDHVGDHVEVWIAVDGFTQPQNFAFCSAQVANLQAYVAASRRAVIRVPKAGLHTVRVFAKLSEGTASGWLDDGSIVIED